MRIFKKLLALMLVLIMCVSLFATIACNKDNGDTNTNTDTETNTSTNTSTGTTNNPSGKVDYVIQTKTVGGMKLPNVTLAIYEGEDMKEFGTTNDDGILTISLPRGNYTAKVREAPKGYKYNENGYTLNEAGTTVTLSSSLIEGNSFPTSSIVLGQVMSDFKTTDIYGNEITLSGLFNGEDGIAGTDDDKQMVLLNFFFTTCGPCVNEIPYMMAAYEEYKDKIAILGLDPYPDDDATKIRLFAEGAVGSQRAGQDPLNFPVADAPITWAMAIADASGTSSYPTNIIIDRYGVVTLIEVGGITSQTPFNLMFEFFSKADYKQELVTDMEQIMPTETPNVDMPSSSEIGEAINSGDITVEYFGEDDEMSWPFVIKEDENGNKYIFTSNSATVGSPKINSYSQINGKVTLKAGEALAFDYYSNIADGDVFYIFVEGKDVFTITGISTEWENCYAYVAQEEGEYEFSLIYIKDAADDEDPANDGMMIDNVRVVSADGIDKETYISYYAATKPTDKGVFTKYATIVLGDDGFYHVGTKTGPLLLVEMINSTQFSNLYSVAMLIYGVEGYTLNTLTNEELVRLEEYANYASNSSFYGLCPVTEELKEILVKIAAELGDSKNENEWLELCEYFGAYGTTKQIENPIKGLADFCAFDTVERTEENPDAINYVVYDRGQIMPRGLLFKFVPTKSGVYRITSDSKEDVDGWIFLDTKKTLYQDGDMGERLAYVYTNNDPGNCTMVAYMEAGKAYYIDIAYYDVTMTGSFTFTVDYIAEEFNYFVVASQGPFTTDLGDDIDVGNGSSDDDVDNMLGSGIIAGGVDVILGGDNIYYVLGTHESLEDAQRQANSEDNAYLCTDKDCKQCQIFARNYYAQLTLKTIRGLYERYNEDESVTSFNVAFRDDEALARALNCIEAYILADEAEMETRALSVATTLANYIQTRLMVTNYIESLVELINALVIDENELANGDTLVASEISSAFDAFENDLKSYDDFYHSIGSKLYADFLFTTNIFAEKNIKQLIEANAFDLSRSANDQQVLAWVAGFEVEYIVANLDASLKGGLDEATLINIINGKATTDNTALLDAIEVLRSAYKADKQIALEYFKAEWQDEYEANLELYQVQDVLNGILHGARHASEDDKFILEKIEEFKVTYGENNWQVGFVELWGDNFATNYDEVYKVEEVIAGKYHGDPVNYTDDIKVYLDMIIDEESHPDNPELHGCVVVDKELAEMLQILMDKFTFEGVEHSWTKLCYYYIALKA